LRRADHSSKESYRLCKKDYENEEEARAQQKGCRAIKEEEEEEEEEDQLKLIQRF
jgi:hypothetical protein